MFEFEYMNLVVDIFKTVHDTQKEMIRKLALLFADNIREDRMIHVFGTGHSHMVGIEMFVRAGGLANVNAMLDPDTLTSNGARRSGAIEKCVGMADIVYDQYDIKPKDIMIITSNSGRNAMPIEMALRAKKEGVITIALTNLHQSKETTSRHPSGKKLYEIVDYVVDNCVPAGDALMSYGTVKSGPASSMTTLLIVNTILTEALTILHQKGFKLPVFQSQNVDGVSNDWLYEKYADRVKHI